MLVIRRSERRRCSFASACQSRSIPWAVPHAAIAAVKPACQSSTVPPVSKARTFICFMLSSAGTHPCGWHHEVADDQPQTLVFMRLQYLAQNVDRRPGRGLAPEPVSELEARRLRIRSLPLPDNTPSHRQPRTARSAARKTRRAGLAEPCRAIRRRHSGRIRSSTIHSARPCCGRGEQPSPDRRAVTTKPPPQAGTRALPPKLPPQFPRYGCTTGRWPQSSPGSLGNRDAAAKRFSPRTTRPAEETIATRRCDSAGPLTHGLVSKSGHSSSARRFACPGGRSVTALLLALYRSGRGVCPKRTVFDFSLTVG